MCGEVKLHASIGYNIYVVLTKDSEHCSMHITQLCWTAVHGKAVI